MAELILKPGREKSLLRRHPWVFSGAIDRLVGEPQSGDTVEVLDSRCRFLARAAYSPASQIRARAWTFDEGEKIDAEFFSRKIDSALQMRSVLDPQDAAGEATLNHSSNAGRLIHAESDHLPGLIVDRYADVLVMQSLTAGSEFWRDTLVDLLQEKTRIKDIYERSDADVRLLEGLPSRTGLLRGVEPPDRVEIQENELRFMVDIRQGHKTGFYLDQRLNRQKIRELAGGRDVLDCFCYTGGFTLAALAGGAASLLAVDTSSNSIDAGKSNLVLNSFVSEKVEWLEGDVFYTLRSLRDRRRSFDMVVLDPPKFASNSNQVERAARGYKDINLLAFKLLRAGGILATFSCSGSVNLELFQKIIAGAALDAGVEARVAETLFQDCDHPTALNFPEGAYLKGLLVYVG
jgi:23S rRNA (cytosine1962-C5)-methyltransferase